MFIMEEKVMLTILDKIIWLIDRNRFVEARRIVKQELDNLKGITEKNCKLLKLRKDFCNHCRNYNCNLNK